MGAFCPVCGTLLSKSWRGFFCKSCGYLDPSRDPWAGQVEFVSTSAGLAFASLVRVLPLPGGRPLGDWPYQDARRTFDAVAKHFPRYIWNSSPSVRAEYFESLSRLATSEGTPPKRVLEPLCDARDQSLVDLKTAIYGRKGASGGFDPMVDGPFQETYTRAAGILDQALVEMSARYEATVFCSYCGLVVLGRELDARKICSGEGCVDCLGIRQSYASSFDEAVARESHRGDSG